MRNSHLSYMDYATCTNIFFLRLPEALKPEGQAILITDDETLYQIGFSYDQNNIFLTRIIDENVEMFQYPAPVKYV